MLTTITNTTKCDMRDCKNDAQYFVQVKGRVGKCFFCPQCLAELSVEGRVLTTPKSPKNTIKKQMERKLEEQNYVQEQEK